MSDPARQTDSAQQLSVQIDTRDDAVVVSVGGELDLLTAPALRERLGAHLAGPPDRVVLDLNDIVFLGSAGLAELVSANETASGNGVRLVLVADGRVVLRPLEVTGLNALFHICGTLDDALTEG